MPDSEAKRKWDAENTERINIKFQKKTETDILEFLRRAAEENAITRQAVIKAAIREHMTNHPEE